MNLIGLQLVLTCQRTGCDAQEVLEVTQHETVRQCMAAVLRAVEHEVDAVLVVAPALLDQPVLERRG